MAGPPVSCRTWLFFDLRLEWGPPSFMASFPPSGEGVLVWRRVTGWEIRGVGLSQELAAWLLCISYGSSHLTGSELSPSALQISGSNLCLFQGGRCHLGCLCLPTTRHSDSAVWSLQRAET